LDENRSVKLREAGAVAFGGRDARPCAFGSDFQARYVAPRLAIEKADFVWGS